MKHVANYFDFIYEGKKQHSYTLKTGKSFNIFDLLSELKKVNAEVLDNKPGKNKDEIIINVALDESKKDKAEEIIKKYAEIIEG